MKQLKLSNKKSLGKLLRWEWFSPYISKTQLRRVFDPPQTRTAAMQRAEEEQPGGCAAKTHPQQGNGSTSKTAQVTEIWCWHLKVVWSAACDADADTHDLTAGPVHEGLDLHKLRHNKNSIFSNAPMFLIHIVIWDLALWWASAVTMGTKPGCVVCWLAGWDGGEHCWTPGVSRFIRSRMRKWKKEKQSVSFRLFTSSHCCVFLTWTPIKIISIIHRH